jgi:Glycosyl hydrolases family 6
LTGSTQAVTSSRKCSSNKSGLFREYLRLLSTAAALDTGVPLLDADLWVKTPGQSDGQCDAAGGVRAWDYSAYSQPGPVS